MANHITLAGLPLVNLKRKPFRTAALTIVVTMLTMAFYGGSLLSMNLEAGLNSMQERMGADLMVTPQNTKNEAEALLTNGSASTFYFTNDITGEVAKADGIDEITEQAYISSLAAACCDEKVQIIGFNPDTDFVITPWIASQFDGTLQRGQIVAGASINVSGNNTVKLYGHEFPVAAQLANTGTSLDNSVFVNMQTVPDVVGYSAKVGHAAIPEEYADKAVSAVLIKVKDGYSAQQVAANITKTTGIKSLGYVYPGGITATTKSNLNVIIRYVTIFVAVFWIMGLIVLLAVFSSAMNEREGISHDWSFGRSCWHCGRISCDFPVQYAYRTAAAVAVSASQHMECVGIDRSEFRARSAYRTTCLRGDGGETLRSRNLSDFERR